MDERIKKYLQKNKLLSWSMQDGFGVYCANAFYAFDCEDLSLIIASHIETRHIKLARINPNISINIARLNKLALLQGIQAKGIFLEANARQVGLYYERFPFAIAYKGSCFALRLDYVKFTDNAFFGKKLIFERD